MGKGAMVGPMVEPVRMRMMNEVLMVPRNGTAPTKRKQKKAKRSNIRENLGNIKAYFTQLCLKKDLDSNTENEGGAGGKKRKMVEEMDLSADQQTKMPSTTSMESTSNSGCADSRTLDPVHLGENLFVGGSQAVDERRGLELKEKDGRTARGTKTRRLMNV